MAKVKQTLSELEDQLSDQLTFLQNSASSFDNGCLGEAKRMALSIRVLVHDTSKSKSLLKQLGKKEILFHDSSKPFDPANIISQFGLLSLSLNKNYRGYSAVLDTRRQSKRVTFNEWWNGIIISDHGGQTMTRQELILSISDKDGGAHVDPTLDEKYVELFRRNSLDVFLHSNGTSKPMADSHLISTRQIAHEVLKTLIDNYSIEGTSPKKLIHDDTKSSEFNPNDSEIIEIKGPYIEKGRVVSVPHRNNKVGRNEKCTCGSGLKFKYCHGRS